MIDWIIAVLGVLADKFKDLWEIAWKSKIFKSFDRNSDWLQIRNTSEDTIGIDLIYI